MTDALSPEDALSMTHQTPVPPEPYAPPGNPRVGKSIGDFATGGLQRALDLPNNAVGRALQNPDNMIAMPGVGMVRRLQIAKPVLEALRAKGLTNPQIAEHLGISLPTLERNIANYRIGRGAQPVVRSPTPESELQTLRNKNIGITPERGQWTILPDGTVQRTLAPKLTNTPAIPQSGQPNVKFLEDAIEEPVNVKDLAEYLRIFSHKE